MLSLTRFPVGYFLQIKAHSDVNHRQNSSLVFWTVDAGSAYLCRFEVQLGFDIHHWLGPRRHGRMFVFLLVLIASGQLHFIILNAEKWYHLQVHHFESSVSLYSETPVHPLIQNVIYAI